MHFGREEHGADGGEIHITEPLCIWQTQRKKVIPKLVRGKKARFVAETSFIEAAAGA